MEVGESMASCEFGKFVCIGQENKKFENSTLGSWNIKLLLISDIILTGQVMQKIIYREIAHFSASLFHFIHISMQPGAPRSCLNLKEMCQRTPLPFPCSFKATLTKVIKHTF